MTAMSDQTILVEHDVSPMKLAVLAVDDWPEKILPVSRFEQQYPQTASVFVVQGRAVLQHKRPEGEPKRPEGEPKRPEGEPKRPEGEPKRPEGEPNTPQGSQAPRRGAKRPEGEPTEATNIHIMEGDLVTFLPQTVCTWEVVQPLTIQSNIG